jgi:DNA polymerase-3 subunit delta'
MSDPLFSAVVGQEEAVAALRAAVRSPVHAYLLVGPSGVGKRAAARAFAACLLCPDGGCGICRHCRLALATAHPDLEIVERSGPFIGVNEAREITRLAVRTPLEARRRVLVLTDFHLVDKAAPALLKTIEEPPPSTVFVILADRIVPDLVTIASRCVTIELRPLIPSRLVEILQAEGAPPPQAELAARAAGGSLGRARLLAADQGLAVRQQAWAAVRGQLDGSGATVAVLVDKLLTGTDAALEPVRARQRQELERLEEVAMASGERGVPGHDEVEKRHRRELRRIRADELRAGLATLARSYAQPAQDVAGASVPGGDRQPGGRGLQARRSAVQVAAATRAVAAIDEASRALDHNPNESLLLEALLLRLSAVEGEGVT